MARKSNKIKTYVVTVKDRPDYCGEGAGGAQFALGKAVINSEHLANWFKEHDGYEVEEQEQAAEETADAE